MAKIDRERLEKIVDEQEKRYLQMAKRILEDEFLWFGLLEERDKQRALEEEKKERKQRRCG